MTHISLVRHAAILIKYKAKRLFNTFANLHNKKIKLTTREATQPKSTKAWVLALVFTPLIIFGAFNQGHQIIMKTLAQLNQRELYAPDKQLFPAWRCDEQNETFKYKKRVGVCIPAKKSEFSQLSRRAHANLTLIFLMAFLGVLIFGIAEKNFAKSDSDFEWLSTLPITKNNLVLIKFLEKTVLNGSGLFFLLPLISMSAFTLNSTLTSILVTLFLYFSLISICSMIQVFAQLGLKLLLPLSKLKNLHAILSLLPFVPMFFVFMIPAEHKPFLLAVKLEDLGWLKWTPFDLAVKIIATTNLTTLLISTALLILEIGLIYFILSKSLRYLLIHGISELSHQETTSKSLIVDKMPQLNFLTRWLTPLQRNELRLIFRDKSFMSRTLLVPFVMMGMNLYVYTLAADNFTFTPRQLSILSIAPLYTFIFSLLSMLIAENQTFWLAKTFPLPLSDFFRQKINLWIGLSFIFPTASILYVISGGARINLNTSLILLSIIGFSITYAYIAASIAIVGSNSYNESSGFGNTKVIYTYCYMILMTTVSASIYKNEVWPIVTTFIISLITAKALWQKAKQQLPFLLDSVAKPTPLITQLDGILAVSIFFVLQTLFALILLFFYEKTSSKIIFIAFACAGLFTCTSAAIIYAKERPYNFPRLVNKNFMKSAYYGLVGGFVAAFVGVIYTNFIHSKNYFSEDLNTRGPEFSYWMFAAVVICAPLFEEYIFRGLLFNGLRQDKKPIYSVIISALLFAIIHPPFSVVPVFILGVLTAIAFEMTGSLIASILIHAIYNFIIISQVF